MSKLFRFHVFFIIFLLSSFSTIANEPKTFAGIKGQSNPNIILIMADDLGYSDLGSYGGEIQTPNLDRLAKEGMRFKNFYNNAKCTTSRVSLMSGRYPERHSERGDQMLTSKSFTLPQAMKKAGYRTILSGKWHLGSRKGMLPFDRGFDEFYGFLGGLENYFQPKGRFHNKKRIKSFPENYYASNSFTDFAVNEINKSLKQQQPYFLYLAYGAPHYPLHAPEKDIAKYKGRYAKGWQALREERYQRMKRLGIISSDTKLPALDPDTQPWTGSQEMQRIMEVHAAMVDNMDQNIGRILSLLDKTGSADNTIVMFLSDNGATFENINKDKIKNAVIGGKDSYRSIGSSWGNALNSPFRKHKTRGHEGGMATPFIVRWPDTVAANTWSNSIGHIIDLQPTLMAAAGLNPVQGIPYNKSPLDGENLLSVFGGQETLRKKPIYMEWIRNRGMRDGDWKLAYYDKDKRWQLFNLADDRTETHDLSKTHPEKLQQMVTKWTTWAKTSGFDPDRVLPWEKKKSLKIK